MLRRATGYDPLSAVEEDDGTFWISYPDFLRHFDSFHANWDPAAFAYKKKVHVRWDAGQGPKRDAFSLGGNPQYAFETEGEGEIWLLLSKHVVEKVGSLRGRRA